MKTKQNTRISSPFQAKDYPYFRTLWNRLVLILLASAFIPFFCIGGGVYYYATTGLQAKSRQYLSLQARKHSQMIDQLLQARMDELKTLGKILGVKELERTEAIHKALDGLQSGSKAGSFVDLGLVSPEGIQTSYAGPFQLQGHSYANAKWYQQALNNGQCISDVSLGKREKPHLVLAVAIPEQDKTWVLRGNVNIRDLSAVLSEMQGSQKSFVYLADTRGVYQGIFDKPDKLPQKIGLEGLSRFEGVKLQEHNGKCYAMTWLDSLPWICVVQMQKDQVFLELKKAKLIGLSGFALGTVLILVAVLLTTDYLVYRLEIKRKNIKLLDQQLLNMSRMASSLQISFPYFREQKDVLANLDTGLSLCMELLHTDNPAQVESKLKELKTQVRRSFNSLDKFLSFVRPPGTSWLIQEVQLNDLLSDLLEFLHNEFRLKGIEPDCRFAPELPPLRTNLPRMRQVLQNLLLAVLEDISPKKGRIELITERSGTGVMLRLSYAPEQLDAQVLDRISDPLQSTQLEGPGMWVAICVDQVKKLKGNISLQADSGQSLTFVLEFPAGFFNGSSPE